MTLCNESYHVHIRNLRSNKTTSLKSCKCQMTEPGLGCMVWFFWKPNHTTISIAFACFPPPSLSLTHTHTQKTWAISSQKLHKFIKDYQLSQMWWNNVKTRVFVVTDLENSFHFFLRGVLLQLFCPIVNLNYLIALGVMAHFEFRFNSEAQSLCKSRHGAQGAGAH